MEIEALNRTIESVPIDLWQRAKSQAALDNITLRQWIMNAMYNALTASESRR